jgi:triosephosphate isomerase
MNKLIIGNWKLNPESINEAEALARSVDRRGVVVCPPFIYLTLIKKVLKRAKLGSQDAFWLNKGAYTGEVSPSQLKGLGVEYVILGHSERRQYLLESDEVINHKVRAVLDQGLSVVLCIGETLEIHERGRIAVLRHLKDQVKKALAGVPLQNLKNLIVAYEPIWAIGTGKVESPMNADKIAIEIKKLTNKKTPVLYGGSINSDNAASFLEQPHIDGLLIGGVSLKPKEFNKIGA